MNYSTAVFLVNDNIRAILGTYEAEENAKRTMFKTLDPTIKVGDYIVVPTDTRHKMTVLKVTDVGVEVDFDSNTQVPWVISTLDRASYENTLAQESTMIDAIKSAELRKKRDELRKALVIDAEAIRGLQISKMGQTPVLEASKT